MPRQRERKTLPAGAPLAGRSLCTDRSQRNILDGCGCTAPWPGPADDCLFHLQESLLSLLPAMVMIARRKEQLSSLLPISAARCRFRVAPGPSWRLLCVRREAARRDTGAPCRRCLHFPRVAPPATPRAPITVDVRQPSPANTSAAIMSLSCWNPSLRRPSLGRRS